MLQISNLSSLQPHIPIEIWMLMEKQQSLSPVFWKQHRKITPDAVHFIRGLGDLKILKSYFLLVWSKWYYPHTDLLNEMEVSIREEFGGIGMWSHRKDLINRLEQVLEDLNTESKHGNLIGCFVRILQYGKLKEVLLDMDREEDKILAVSVKIWGGLSYILWHHLVDLSLSVSWFTMFLQTLLTVFKLLCNPM
ncbi:hypothetical protein BJ322DRAFT_1216914 [Thelephora terrestris]|uniref:Uncharacterized protein n=1 Tax=Thelephora terrestris TaxID=56493 RepID=A0A9P6HLQ9_9AGAM|nr:hypothetical protein BJ322DRAFT_1216914 [Thelephora terrestris]